MERFNQGFTLFLSLLVEAMPFLLLGVLLSSLLLIFVDERKLIEIMPRNPLLGALAGSVFGFLFPVCECGNVPVARRLLIQGIPPSVGVGFLLAAPTINPIVIWSTWTAFRGQPEIVVMRIVLSLSIATIIGWIFSAQADIRPLLQPSVARAMPAPRRATQTGEADSAAALLQGGTFIVGGAAGQPMPLDSLTTMSAAATAAVLPQEKIWGYRLRLVLDNLVQEMRELGGVLVLGSAIAAVIQTAVPREIILNLGQGPVTSIIAMMALAAVISICSTVDSFFALSFASSFTSGALLSFLVFGPMIDLKAIGLLLSVFRARAVLYLILLAGQLAFLSTLFINLHVS